MKATYVEKYGEGFEIFKNPITDDGMKKSAKGLVTVIENKGKLELKDQVTWNDVYSDKNILKLVYFNGEFLNTTSLSEIRKKLNTCKY